MNMKRILIWLSVLLVCGMLLLSIFIGPKVLRKKTADDTISMANNTVREPPALETKTLDDTISMTNNTTREPSELDTWVGNYSFSEYAPPNQNMFYSITIYFEGNDCFAEISINGFQTLERLLAKVSGDSNSIRFEFLKYLPDNVFEPYQEGNVLLIFEREESKLITYWGEIGPLLIDNRRAGEYFEQIFSAVENLKELQGKGLQIIEEQSFAINLENWGEVEFISAAMDDKVESMLDKVKFLLVDQENSIIYRFPDFSDYWFFEELRAVSFSDVNSDGLKDVIIIADFTTGVGREAVIPFPVCKIYFQQDKSFRRLVELDDQINGASKNENIEMVLEFVKDKVDHINTLLLSPENTY